MFFEPLASGQNPKVKELLELLQKASARRESGLFAVEGRREAERCLGAGFKARSLFFCEEIIPSDFLQFIVNEALKLNPAAKLFSVSRKVYEKISYREGTEGIVAEVFAKGGRLEDLKLRPDALVAVLENVEKPGNLGAVLRSADAAGACAVISCGPLTDLYNPNLIRASLGACFTVQTAAASSEDTIKWLKKNGIKILSAQLQDSRPYYDCDMKGPVALALGAEDKGLSELWRKAADQRIRIPMLGVMDSLNVSVSASVLLYEAVRQRTAGRL